MVIANIVQLRGEYELVGFLDDVNLHRHGFEFFHMSILGGKEQLEILHDQGVHSILPAFGKNDARLKLSDLVRSKGYEVPTAIHPQATVASDAQIGQGTMINAGAVIDPGVTIGENVIIGACCTIGHSSLLGNGARTSAGVNLAGYVTIGEAAWLGSGAAVKDRIRIGSRSLIGIGSCVVQDIPDGVVAYGVPAKVIRKSTPDDF